MNGVAKYTLLLFRLLQDRCFCTSVPILCVLWYKSKPSLWWKVRKSLSKYIDFKPFLNILVPELYTFTFATFVPSTLLALWFVLGHTHNPNL